MFGERINLIVTPQDRSPVKPDLFILSPLSEQTGRLRPDVCLAAGFRPRGGQMVLRVESGSDHISTSTAVLSPTQKTYFFTGFSRNTIDSCELQGTVKRREEENPKCEETEDLSPTVETKKPEDLSPTVETKKPEDLSPTEETKKPEDLSPTEETKKPEDRSPTEETKKPEDRSPTVETKKPEDRSPTEETKKREDRSPTVETKKPEDRSPTVETKKPEDRSPTVETKKREDRSPTEEKPVETVCQDFHPEGARLNFYLLLLNSVRVVFTKTVAFSTMVTIRALLF